MGEENTWFDFLPGLRNLSEFLKHYLGREEPSQAFYFRGGPFTDSEFGLTHVLSVLLVLLFVTTGALSFRAAARRGSEEAIVPPPRFSLRNLFEMLGDAIFGITSSVMGEKNARRYLPLIGTLACFIFFSNILGLIPGMAPPTATLKTNLALALSVFFITHYEGVKAQGAGTYLKHFLGPVLWLAPLMVIIEIISHLSRPVSLSLRLLGNMVSDHKVVGVFFFLVPLLIPVPFLVLGTLVCVMQTFVFCLLTMMYINLAVTTHESHDDHPADDHGSPVHAHN